MARHVMTPARKAALRKAQLASARNRKHVTVIHYTSPRKARKIVKQQKFKTHSGLRAPGNKKNMVYGTRRRSRFYKHEFRSLGRKSAAVTFKVAGKHVKADPNDVWFQKHPMVTSAKHKPAKAVMVSAHAVHGRKISHLGPQKRKKRR